MKFNRVEKDYLTVLRGRNRPPWAPIKRDFVTVQGMAGAHLSASKTQIRQIDVPVFIMAESFSNLQELKEDMAEWLIHEEPKELIFPDEPDRTYYAVVDGSLDLNEIVRWGEGVITFLCPGPYKYGPEQTLALHDISTIQNKGTAQADPVFELTATKKTTFAMVSKGDEYNLIGKPANVDEIVVDEKTSVVDENGDTLDAWTASGQGNFVKGTLGIQVGSYGSGSGWHGAQAKTEITPIQDFELEFVINITNEYQVERTYRNTVYMYDENMNEIAHMRMWDYSQATFNNIADVRIGEYSGDSTDIYLADKNNYNLTNQKVWNGILRMTRKGNKFETYIARVTQNGVHVDTLKPDPYYDVNNDFTGKLKYITIGIAKHGTLGANEIGINRVIVKELNKLTVDQTPYLLDVGDIVTFDHKNDDILINGESRNDLKNFGGSFLKLDKGENQIVVTPEDSFNSKVTFRDKYL